MEHDLIYLQENKKNVEEEKIKDERAKLYGDICEDLSIEDYMRYTQHRTVTILKKGKTI